MIVRGRGVNGVVVGSDGVVGGENRKEQGKERPSGVLGESGKRV